MRLKPEDRLRANLAAWMRKEYPDVFFNMRIDKNTAYGNDKNYQCGINSGMPDMEIFFPTPRYAGLHLELKTEKGDPFKLMPRKKAMQIENTDKLGLFTAYAAHLRQQAFRLSQLNQAGYFACFAVGESQAEAIIRWYLDRGQDYFANYSFTYKPPGKYELPKKVSIPVVGKLAQVVK